MRSWVADRPRLDLPRSPVEMALQLVAAAGVVAGALLLAARWGELPASVPRHFGIDGRPDAWGAPSWMLVLPVASVGLWLALTLVEGRPHSYNYPVRITPENAPRQYRLARTLLATIKAVLVWSFTAILRQAIEVATGEATGLGGAFLPLFVGLLGVVLVVYFVQARRAS